ncbi:DUF1642 domain-containing protein [Lactococcus formosensis]|uniref:DUF1642 domain-containing protein n=1 Tax=Lactococcus formosensis TaxID=1281486 RepID=UPI001F067907|nr:DUF1642 domain-containing protein [Lactococcus formosensis]MCH1722660.1 DUF1642 domain-containing protein [Lactococcus formosensis]
MKKFEEEMKEWFGSPTGFNMEFQSGYEAYSALIKRFKDWVSPEDYEKYIKESTDNTSKLLGKINDLKSQLEKQQPEFPEVPHLVADWLDKKPLYAINGSIPVEIIEWSQKQTGYADLGMNISHLLKLKVNGYTVAKEKRFYLKNKLTGLYLYESKKGFFEQEKLALELTSRCDYSQQEIDSMETGSYEKIEVEE